MTSERIFNEVPPCGEAAYEKVSRRDGRVSETKLVKNGDRYGRVREETDDGELITVWDVTADALTEPFLAHAFGLCDWTEVVLSGNSDGQNTVVDPYGVGSTAKNTVPCEIFDRFYRVPDKACYCALSCTFSALSSGFSAPSSSISAGFSAVSSIASPVCSMVSCSSQAASANTRKRAARTAVTLRVRSAMVIATSSIPSR